MHVSLREVPATPINIRKSFNMSYKELQLARSNLLLSPHGSQGELRPATGSTPCRHASFLSFNQYPASPGSSASSAKEYKDLLGPNGGTCSEIKCDASQLAHFGKAAATCSADLRMSKTPEKMEPIFTIVASTSSSP